ncbi:uncharacterized protein LOC126656722 [Mercurialis annua]|uniref:uncharacterized protein LOC126656722 n=1 Tax=Mercurialis annua TaxID=3986 RepID=UPI00215F60FD|nr:uncharacterized protein LOC126656722 [Mercurialis annua]
MSVSFEALAMAGVDHLEWGMDFDEWERNELDEPPPPHLLLDDEDDEITKDFQKEVMQIRNVEKHIPQWFRVVLLMVKVIVNLLIITEVDFV